ncbi:uncharacterized protein LOC128128466 isoform X1 [Lactuca sativa]|uniref:uncharacterized protein LOC128128466 isoform X1 n=1 Tax=Lactuca sativa TaxID=4236 RepID=UPI0022AEEAFD|nr:uncharacterized protein LOC128128466 isoform X1 [Lactuca sativa]
MVDSHRHLPLLVADAVVLVAVMFQPRLVAVAYAALMSLQLLLSVPRDGHACISQGCECVVASSSSEVWSFGLAGNQERAPPTPAAAGHHKVVVCVCFVLGTQFSKEELEKIAVHTPFVQPGMFIL